MLTVVERELVQIARIRDASCKAVTDHMPRLAALQIPRTGAWRLCERRGLQEEIILGERHRRRESLPRTLENIQNSFAERTQ